MIALDVKQYCMSGCPNFEPEMEKIKVEEYFGDARVNTYIHCTHEKSCQLIFEYMERKKKDEHE